MASFVLADDSKVARNFLRTVLLENGHTIIAEATNGEEGYELYAKYRPDIMMIDITMPVLNGIDCLKKIRSEFPKAKVIIVTSIGKDSKRNEAIIEGALDYIVKPFDPVEVMKSVERCIRA